MPCSRTASASCRSARARESWSVPTIRANTLSVFTRADCGSSGARRAAMSSITTSTPVGVRALGCVRGAPDLVEQGGGCAAALGVVAVLNRKILAYDLLESGAVGRLRAEALALLA